MGASGGPNLVDNGLVLMLDVANVKSFQGESTSNILNTDFGLDTTFENQSFTNWGFYDGGSVGGTAEFYTNDSYQGNTSVKLTNSTGSHIAFGGLTWAVIPGDVLTVSIYSKNINIPSIQYFLMRGSVSGDHTVEFSSTYNWVRYTYTYTATASENLTVWIRTYENAVQGSFLIDCFQVERKSYVTPFVNGTRTTILDTSGNGKHHTMINIPIYSDSPPKVLLDETKGFSYPAAITTSTTCTVVLFYKTTDVTELWVKGNQSGAYYLSASDNNTYYHNACGSPTNFIDLISVSNPYASGYKDGNYHMWEAKNVDFSTWTYFDWFLYGGGWNMIGSVSLIMVYNRSLTSAESLQNFTALKNRYIPLGSTRATAANSAQDIKTTYPSVTNGVYWINLPTVGPTQIYCIMDSSYDGGGWMMMMKSTRGTTFNYDASYWTTTNTLNPTDLTQNDADAKYDVMNYFPSKDMMARWPDIANVGGESGSIDGLSNWTWLENNFNGGSNVVPTYFFANPSLMRSYYSGSGTYGGSGNFIQDAKTYSGWASGVFSSQVDIRFYGYNYIPNQSYGFDRRARWGFGFNENGEGLFPCTVPGGAPGSNDLGGGIGLGVNNGNYSAGDLITCCQDTTGINRSARVEVYVR